MLLAFVIRLKTQIVLFLDSRYAKTKLLARNRIVEDTLREDEAIDSKLIVEATQKQICQFEIELLKILYAKTKLSTRN